MPDVDGARVLVVEDDAALRGAVGRALRGAGLEVKTVGNGTAARAPADHASVGPAGRQPLTPTEYRVLAALMGAPGQVVRRRALVAAGWPHGAFVAENPLDQYVARLRRKLAVAGDADRAIVTVHG